MTFGLQFTLTAREEMEKAYVSQLLKGDLKTKWYSWCGKIKAYNLPEFPCWCGMLLFGAFGTFSIARYGNN